MSQDNRFHQYGYSHYLKAPKRPAAAGRTVDRERGTYPNFLQSFKQPIVAVGLLFVTAALFVALVTAVYPFAEDETRHIPIVRADLRPLKIQPLARGGMSIPNHESALFAAVGQPEGLRADRVPIENLFPETVDDLINKEQAIAAAMAQSSREPARVESLMPAAEEEPVEIQEVPVTPLSFLQKTASAALRDKPKRSKTYAAATAPETLEFVRNILKQKENKHVENPSSIEPATGKARSATAIAAAGTYFVQLASITDRTRAKGEWVKMRTRYAALSVSAFRVQEATLARGTFYRIQAGPMSKAKARAMCDALKTVGKPGGCLVVQ